MIINEAQNIMRNICFMIIVTDIVEPFIASLLYKCNLRHHLVCVCVCVHNCLYCVLCVCVCVCVCVCRLLVGGGVGGT